MDLTAGKPVLIQGDEVRPSHCDCTKWSPGTILPVASVLGLITVAVTKTLWTKAMFYSLEFHFPILTCAISCMATLVAISPMFLVIPLKPIPRNYYGKFALIAVLTCVDLSCMNLGLDRLSVSVQQALNAATPAAVILFEFLMFQKVRSFYVYLPFLPLLAGTVLTTIGSDSHRSSPDGVIYMLVAIVSGALKAITTHEFLVGLRHQVGVLSFLFWIDLAMLLLLLPAAAVFSEYQHIQTWDRLYQVVPWIIVIANGLFGGVRAWLVKVVLKYNTALTKVVCDIIIKAATIGLSIVVFGTVLPKIMVAGICLTIFGFTMYSAAAFYEKVYGCESQTPPKDSRASHTKSLEGVHVSSPTESYITSSDQSIRLEDEDVIHNSRD